MSDLFAAQRAVLAVHSVATALRGAVLRLITDDKGTRFLISCGVPGFAAADDAWRALSIAIKCHAALAELGVGCAAGVTTGYCFCGESGCTSRAEYTLHGRRVNLAARLMTRAAAEGYAVLCDDETEQQTRTHRPQQAFTPLDVAAIKGFAEPVGVFAPALPPDAAGASARGSSSDLNQSPSGVRLIPPPLDSSAGDHFYPIEVSSGRQPSGPQNVTLRMRRQATTRGASSASLESGGAASEESGGLSARRSSIAPAAIAEVAEAPALLGRETEVSALERRIDDLAARCGGGVLIVEGEAGVGKSALLLHALAHARSLGVAAVAECADADAAVGGHAALWERVLPRVFPCEYLETLVDQYLARHGSATGSGGDGDGRAAEAARVRTLDSADGSSPIKLKMLSLEGLDASPPPAAHAAAAEEGEEEATPRADVGAQPSL